MRLQRTILIVAFICLTYAAFAQEFRKTSWLMTKAEVVASEGTRAVYEASFQGQQQVIYQSLVFGFAATITYLLENDKLLAASYAFKRDSGRSAWDAMKKDLTTRDGTPSFQNDHLLVWRLANTEIAVTHLPDGSTRADYWEKTYFARINSMPTAGN
jgi:hypothetical protein